MERGRGPVRLICPLARRLAHDLGTCPAARRCDIHVRKPFPAREPAALAIHSHGPGDGIRHRPRLGHDPPGSPGGGVSGLAWLFWGAATAAAWVLIGYPLSLKALPRRQWRTDERLLP